MDPIDALELSWKQGAELVAALRPDELTLPTPCAGWDVRRLLNHTLGEVVMMTRVNGGQPGGSDDHGDLVGDGLSLGTLWDELGRDNVASWRDGGLEGDRAYFYGTFPAGAAVVMNLGEVLVHSWDLAQATGQWVRRRPRARRSRLRVLQTRCHSTTCAPRASWGPR